MFQLPQSPSNSIFDRTHRNLHSEHLPNHGSIYSFGDPAFPDFDESFFVIPSLATGRKLVTQYFDLESLSSSLLHPPTILTWTEDLLSNFNTIRNDPSEKSKKAILLMVMAIAYVYTNGDSINR
jgi:hypothetical protein